MRFIANGKHTIRNLRMKSHETSFPRTTTTMPKLADVPHANADGICRKLKSLLAALLCLRVEFVLRIIHSV